jgi:hypothetical protein
MKPHKILTNLGKGVKKLIKHTNGHELLGIEKRVLDNKKSLFQILSL